MDMLPVNRSAAERFRLGLDEITVLATSDQTNGDLFAVEVRMPPGGGPPVIVNVGVLLLPVLPARSA